MAQRNPLNERYQGNGPSGQSRKSASSAKPATTAAASVRIKGKPETTAEKRAAEQERKDKIAKKAAERQRKAARAKQAERTVEAKARVARGEGNEAKSDENVAIIETTEDINTLSLEERVARFNGNVREDPEYKKYRLINWLCLGAAGVFMVLTFFFMSRSEDGRPNMFVLVPSYVFLGLSLVAEFTKIRPITLAYRNTVNQADKLSPKQAKHAQVDKAQAAQAAQAKMAKRTAKRHENKKAVVADEQESVE
ncbi:MAG: hypothetical protein FWH40_05300 [Coriobacteriia bacterium]|nr:hypothetical protein [Coriobacteriia bacterium]